MVKVIDIDELFDKYIAGYVYSNIGKVKPEEIENKMPVLYNEFGNEKLKELDGKTPNSYYKDFSDKELLDCLKAHIEKKVAVSDFLCEAIIKKDSDKAILEYLSKDKNEEFLLYLMNILNDKNSKIAVKEYFNFIVGDYTEPVRELATELLGDFADLIKEDALKILDTLSKDKRECIIDVLSKAKKDDRIFDILIAEFKNNPKKRALYAGYLGRFNDERALPYLLEAIEKDDVDYADFEELRFAIESLGGQYDKERDFKNDTTFNKIKSHKQKIL